MHFDCQKIVRAAAVFAIAAAGIGANAVADGAVSPEGAEFFEAHIRPVLVEKCFSCHSAQAKVLKGGLRLRHRRSHAGRRRIRPGHRPHQAGRQPAHFRAEI